MRALFISEYGGPDVLIVRDIPAPAAGPGQVLVQVAVSDLVAAAGLVQGMTAHFLTTSIYPAQAGDWALVHAAAGGVGLLTHWSSTVVAW